MQMVMKKNPAKMGRPSSFRPEFVKMARHLCKLGATDADLADAFEVSIPTIDTWKAKHPDFLGSLKAGKAEADGRVEQSLYQRAVGYSFNSEKIYCNKDGEVTRVPIVEHVPPDVTAQIFWLKNRKPSEWRDVQNIEHAIGRYIISDRPMTEEEWIRERATLIDGVARTEISARSSITARLPASTR
jgi:hypothetical protein